MDAGIRQGPNHAAWRRPVAGHDARASIQLASLMGNGVCENREIASRLAGKTPGNSFRPAKQTRVTEKQKPETYLGREGGDSRPAGRQQLPEQEN